MTQIAKTGCSIRVETLGNFEGKSLLPRQNWGTLIPWYPDSPDSLILPRHNIWCSRKISRQNGIYRGRIQAPSKNYRGRILAYATPCSESFKVWLDNMPERNHNLTSKLGDKYQLNFKISQNWVCGHLNYSLINFNIKEVWLCQNVIKDAIFMTPGKHDCSI